MIWDHISSEAFRVSYESYTLALEGAIASSVEGLRARTPRLSIVTGGRAVDTIVSGSVQQLASLARMGIADAVNLGRTDAQGPLLSVPELQATLAAQIESVVLNLARTDELTARTQIRNQALTYDIAHRTMSHEKALKKALGQQNDGVFAQLDRAARRIDSAPFATGFVRLGMAQGYLDAFVTAAAAAGATAALIGREGEAPEEFKLSDVQLLRERFHPNTPYSLQALS